MKTMKKYLYLALAAVAVLVSCKREAAPITDEGNGEGTELTGDRVPVQFSTHLLPAPQTKSQGALDQWFAGQKLYIYGIARQGAGSTATEGKPLDLPTATAAGNILINNVQATPLAQTASFDLAEHDAQPIEVLDTDGSYFFYDEDHRYEFFGYYVDDATDADAQTSAGVPTPTVDAEKGISLGVTINGAQDIMLATTDHDEDNNVGGTMINPNRLYSAYSARRGVKPTLNFDHVLSRFNVYVKSGDDSDDTNKKVKLTTVAIETNDKATAWIARTAQFTEKPYLDITGKEKNPSTKDLVTGGWTPAAENPQPFIGVWNAAHDKQLDLAAANKFDQIMVQTWQGAGTVMVIPGKAEYMLKLGVKQLKKGATAASATDEDYSSEVVSYYPIRFEDITTSNNDKKYIDEATTYADYAGMQTDESKLDKTGAVKGHQYDVNIIVYGLQEVQIQVTMTEWDMNGSINMDPGRDYEFKIELTGITSATDPGYSKSNPMPLNVGDTYQIVPVVTPTPHPAVQYTSRKPEAVSVSADGLVTAIAPSSEVVRIDVQVPGDEKHPEGGFTAMYVQVNALQYTVTPADAPKVYIGEPAIDLTGFLTVKEGETTVANPTVAFTIGGTTPYTKASIGEDGKTLTLVAGANAGDVININYTVAADETNHYAAKSGSFTLTVAATGNYTVTEAAAPKIYLGEPALDLTSFLTIKEGETTVTPAVTFTIGGTYDKASIAADGKTLSLLDGAAATDAITINYTIPADTDNHYAAKDGSFTVTVTATGTYTVSEAAVLDIPLLGGAGIDLNSFLTITEDHPDVEFAIGGAYDKASIAADGKTLSLLDGAAANDAITINYTIPANLTDHYAAKEGSFTLTVKVNTYTVTEAAAGAKIISIATGSLDLSTLITSIKEGETAVTPAVTFSIGGDTPYANASLTGSTLTLQTGASAGDSITINYTIAANATTNYAQYQGTFNVNVTE